MIYNRLPFACAERAVRYIGRYTHRVAISNHRLVGIEDGQIRFCYKDHNDGGKQKVMALGADEFIRRFLLHILPEGFKKVRHFGFLGGGLKRVKLVLARRLLAAQGKICQVGLAIGERLEVLVRTCPQCKAGRMVFKAFVERGRFAVLGSLGLGSKLVLDRL